MTTVFKRLQAYGQLVMFSHTLFSVPFGIVAMLWAAKGLPSARVVFWTVIALLAARNGANAINRLIDKEIDAANPRTHDRHLPKGIVQEKEVVWLVVLCFALLVLAAYMLNPLCLYLSPLALFIFTGYSYTKRFTWACHIILGMACGGAAVGGWIAVTGKTGWPGLLLGTVAMLWVAGFDIIYATQDVDFDRSFGLHSIPAKFGIKTALIISTAMHTAALALMFFLYVYMNLGWLYLTGTLIITGLMILEHSMVKPDDLTEVKIASYSINQVVSVVFLLFAALDVFL